jgi:hypothetical protein
VTLVVDAPVAEMCTVHFHIDVPKQTCSICTRGPAKKPSLLRDERVIIATDRVPSRHMHMWTPSKQSLETVPRNRDFVHITTSFSAEQFDLLTERLPQLVLVEVVPSSAKFVEEHIAWFSQYRVGITARRRYRQS